MGKAVNHYVFLIFRKNSVVFLLLEMPPIYSLVQLCDLGLSDYIFYFDLVSHSKLVTKLTIYGILETVHSWLHS